MTLRLKIHLIVAVLTLLFAGVVLGLNLKNMQESVREEVVAANRVAWQLLNRAARRETTQDTAGMLNFLQGMTRVRSNDIMVFDGRSAELYRSPPSPYKVGREAPAWFAKIVSPPPAEQTIYLADGRLVVRANASRAALDAWDDAVVLLWCVGALFVVANGLIYWLVGRAVRPLARIVSALQQLEHGRFDVVLPPLPGREAAAIGSAFNRMVAELAGHIETERRAVRAELQLSDSRELTRWVDRHLEEERRLIARELHDELGQSVTAMRSMALSVAQRVKTTEPEAAQAAGLIAEEASRLYDAMHGIIPRLTPLVLDRLGLADALKDLAERTRRSQPDVRVDLDVDLSDATIPAAAALAVYRAAQEGITNALRHGHAHHLQLALCCKDREVTMTVIDDGRGLPEESGNAEFQTSPAGHHGLRWMADRVEGLGGRVSLTPNSPSGARLQLRFPLRPIVEGTP